MSPPFYNCFSFNMDVVWVLLVFHCFFLCCCEQNSEGVFSTEPNEGKTQKIELFPPNPTYAGQTRMPRTLFKKLHSGAAFLTGLKLGAILSKKGFELGHGKIASTHSFQIFGKSVNSAMSLSYGNAGSLLPLVDDESQEPKRTSLNDDEKKVYRVTVIENLTNETKEDSLQTEETQNTLDEDSKNGLVVLYQDSVEEDPGVDQNDNFLEEHNKRVKEFNDSIQRRKNSKF